jgi:hypothetical protein
MSNRTQWKMLHLLHSSGRLELSLAELKAAGINCLTDTIGALEQQGSPVPVDLGGTHYYEYDLQDLPAGKAMLQAALYEWASDNHAQGVKALYRL